MHDLRMERSQGELPVADHPRPLEAVRRVPHGAARLLQDGEFQRAGRNVKGDDLGEAVPALACADKIIQDGDIRLEAVVDQPLECAELAGFDDSMRHREPTRPVRLEPALGLRCFPALSPLFNPAGDADVIARFGEHGHSDRVWFATIGGQHVEAGIPGIGESAEILMHCRDDRLNVLVTEDGQIQPIAGMGMKPEVVGHQPEQQPRLPAFPEHLRISHIIVVNSTLIANKHARGKSGLRLRRASNSMNEITSSDIGVEVLVFVVKKPNDRSLDRGKIHVTGPDVLRKGLPVIIPLLLLSTCRVETREEEKDLRLQHLEDRGVQHCGHS